MVGQPRGRRHRARIWRSGGGSSARAATWGACVTAMTWTRSASRASRWPMASETAPPTPVSTSSKTRVGAEPRSASIDLERKDEARELAARGDLHHRPGARARIRLDPELDPVDNRPGSREAGSVSIRVMKRARSELQGARAPSRTAAVELGRGLGDGRPRAVAVGGRHVAPPRHACELDRGAASSSLLARLDPGALGSAKLGPRRAREVVRRDAVFARGCLGGLNSLFLCARSSSAGSNSAARIASSSAFSASPKRKHQRARQGDDRAAFGQRAGLSFRPPFELPHGGRRSPASDDPTASEASAKVLPRPSPRLHA